MCTFTLNPCQGMCTVPVVRATCWLLCCHRLANHKPQTCSCPVPLLLRLQTPSYRRATELLDKQHTTRHCCSSSSSNGIRFCSWSQNLCSAGWTRLGGSNEHLCMCV
jgi:hypothetical protein